MRTLIAATMTLLLVAGLTATASAGSSVDPTWGHWDTTGSVKTFKLDRDNVEWATKWADTNDQIATQLLHDGRWSGGEWYDVEGLYLDIVTRTNGHTYLEWLIITSYTGVEPGEWAPTTNWDGDPGEAGSFVAGKPGSYADYRDHGYYQNPGETTTHPWAYRSNPVVAINLTGATTYDYALVLDNSEACNDDDQWAGTPYDITTQAALYSVTAGNAWKWIPPHYQEFPAGRIADVDTAALPLVASGSSTKAFASDYQEAYTDMTGYPNWGVDYWPMAYNWYWTGSIDLTGSTVQLPAATTTTAVHYAMWCSNDLVDLGGQGYNDDDTPELPASALFLLGMVPAGLAWWRRRGR